MITTSTLLADAIATSPRSPGPAVGISLLLLGALAASGCVVEPPHDCADVRAQDPAAGDGDYVVEVGATPLTVHCRDMAGQPTEYLTLPRNHETLGPDHNVSYYGAGNNTSVGGVRTWYSKVRLHLDTLTLNPADATFAHKDGGRYWFGENTLDVVPYGNAADCAGGWSQSGQANIDLTGTPFDVAPDQFQVDGYLPAGTITYASTQVVNLTGGGECGGAAPRNGAIALTLRP